MSGRIPDWVLERHLVGELPKGFTEADLAADPTVPERLEKLRASDAEALEQHPPRVVAARVRLRAMERAKKRQLMLLVPVAAVAVLVAVVAPVVFRPGPGPDVVMKGLEPHLEVFRKGQTQPIASGAVAHPGDVLKLRIVPADAKLAMVVAVDGESAPVPVTPAAMPVNGPITLPDALELDATGGFQRFILVTSDRAFDAAEVVAAARGLGRDPAAKLELPAGMKQSSFVVFKKP